MLEAGESIDLRLADSLVQYRHDPLGFVLFAFDWGMGELVGEDGPDDIQRDILIEIGRQAAERQFDGDTPVAPVRLAVASGHGIGKSTLTAWIVCWILSTRPFCKGIVTANTGDQLETRTWAEIVKWMKRSITSRWFEISQGGFFVRHKDYAESWRVDGVTWSLQKTEAFAGQHAKGSTPFYIFDEASAIPDKIFEVAEGGLTDGEPFEFLFGNPTRNRGFFYDCFHKNRHRWTTRQIDSRKSRFTNKKLIAEWISDFGLDSDFIRVRVLGEFPLAGSDQLIPVDVIQAATSAIPAAHKFDPLIFALDVARFGDCESVLCVRRGQDARTIPWSFWRNLDTMDLADRVGGRYRDMERMGMAPDAVFVDAVGIGAGVADRLRRLGLPVIDINAGMKASDGRIENLGTEAWVRMRDWLAKGGAIPDDRDLVKQLQEREYTYSKTLKMMLVPKERMREEGLESPDRGDALALTFAAPVTMRKAEVRMARRQALTDYNVLEV